METTAQQPELDLFIDELFSSLSEEDVNTGIQTIERKNRKLKLMSHLLVYYFLAAIGIRDGKLSQMEAYSHAANMIRYYKPSFVSETDIEEIQKDTGCNYPYYNRLEFNRLYIQYLVVCCNIDPLEAIKATDDDKFWRKFYPEVKPIDSIDASLPILHGDTDKIEEAKEIRRKQVSDLVILKNHIKNSIETVNKQYIDSLTDETAKQNSWSQYNRKIEIVIAYINSIIAQPLAEYWLATDSLFKYTNQWLERLLAMIVPEIDEVMAAETNDPICCSINYPVLFCNQLPIVKIETEPAWHVSIKEDFRHRLARKYLNDLEVIEPSLAEFCLVLMGVEIAGLDIDKAHKLATKAINSWSCKSPLNFNKVYTRQDLYEACVVYLSNGCNIHHPKILKYLTIFWQTFFPDTGLFFDFLPGLHGTPQQVKLANKIRYDQIEDLLQLTRFIETTCEARNKVVNDLSSDIPISSDIDVLAHLNKIIMRREAQDWLDTSSVVYDQYWLRKEADKLWQKAKDNWQERTDSAVVCTNINGRIIQ